MEWWLDSSWIRVFPYGADRTQCFTHVLAKTYVARSLPTLDLYGLWATWETPNIKGRPHISHLLAAKKSASTTVATELVPLQKHLPGLMDLPSVPPHLAKYVSVSPLPPAAPSSTQPATGARKFQQPGKKQVNFGNFGSASPTPSSPASTITAADNDWKPNHDDEDTVRNILEDPSNDKLASQLTALVAAASLQPSSTYARPPQHSAPTGQARTPFAGVRESRPPRTDTQPSEKPCYAEFVHGVCPHGPNCRYSHDANLIRDERLACMSRWKLGPKAAFSNFNIVSRAFPLESNPDDPDEYSESARNEVYTYLDDIAIDADGTDLP